MNDESADDKPLHIRAQEERDRRGLTQKEAAIAAGMSLRAYQQFETGRSKPQAKHLRGILRALDLDGSEQNQVPAPAAIGSFCPTCRRPIFPDDVQTFLNMWGAHLLTMDEQEQEQHIYRETRRIFESMRHPEGS